MENTALHIFENYLLAILLGALMGLERELRETHLAGLRTFILVTLFGSICGHISTIISASWIIFAGILAVTAHSTLAHFLR
ncbi:MAG: MgtC/SapB family protein, partial [Pseudomonadota bacterium]